MAPTLPRYSCPTRLTAHKRQTAAERPTPNNASDNTSEPVTGPVNNRAQTHHQDHDRSNINTQTFARGSGLSIILDGLGSRDWSFAKTDTWMFSLAAAWCYGRGPSG